MKRACSLITEIDIPYKRNVEADVTKGHDVKDVSCRSVLAQLFELLREALIFFHHLTDSHVVYIRLSEVKVQKLEKFMRGKIFKMHKSKKRTS